MDVILALPRDTNHVRDVLFDSPMRSHPAEPITSSLGHLSITLTRFGTSDNVGFRKRDCRPAQVQHRVICRFKISRDKHTRRSRKGKVYKPHLMSVREIRRCIRHIAKDWSTR
jgi:hypothetical protein